MKIYHELFFTCKDDADYIANRVRRFFDEKNFPEVKIKQTTMSEIEMLRINEYNRVCDSFVGREYEIKHFLKSYGSFLREINDEKKDNKNKK